MDRVRRYAVLMLGVWCACVVLPWTSAAAASRPDGQAMQFRIGSSFSLSSFDGATLAYQRFLGRDVAWRLSLGVDLRYERTEHSEKHAGDYSVDESFDYPVWGHGVSVSSEWLAYRGDQVSLFFGGGPRVSYTSYRDEDFDFYSGTWRRARHSGDTYSVGLQGCIGIQWAATDWLALHAEYSARCMYSHEVQEYLRQETGDDEEHRVESTVRNVFFLDSRGVRFGLSAYF